jgi:ribonucleoside-diphosphate reductase alpha chain
MEGTRLLEANQIFESIAKKRGFWSVDLLRRIAMSGSLKRAEGVPTDVKKIFVTALDISPEWHLKMQASFQKWIDNAVSKTVNLPEDASIDDVKKIYLRAHELHCKGITVYRYGSKPDQVLKIGAFEPLVAERHVIADSEYAGGCLAGACAYSTS